MKVWSDIHQKKTEQMMIVITIIVVTPATEREEKRKQNNRNHNHNPKHIHAPACTRWPMVKNIKVSTKARIKIR